jgi:ATP synthase subunit 6
MTYFVYFPSNLYAFSPLEQFDFYGIGFFDIFFICFLQTFILYSSELEEVSNFALSEDFVLDFFLIFAVFQLLKFSSYNQKANIFFPFVYFLFLTILVSNILGLLPYNGAVAAALIFTFVTGISSLLGLTVLSLVAYFKNIFFFFSPGGSPKFLLKFLILVELLSYIARLISLPTRLFANLISGHILIKILLGFSMTLLMSKPVFKIFFILPWLAFVFVLFLELLVGFLQAYVFVFLLIFYLGQALVSGRAHH